MAPALSAAGIPFVIGMQQTVCITAATCASGVIYWAVVAGVSLQHAVSHARQTLYDVALDDQESLRAFWRHSAERRAVLSRSSAQHHNLRLKTEETTIGLWYAMRVTDDMACIAH